MKKFTLAAILLASGVSSAFAVDPSLAPYPPYQMPVWSWTGLYVGGDVGYGSSTVDHSVTVNALSVSTKPSGFLGGIHGGEKMANWLFFAGLFNKNPPAHNTKT